MIRQRKIFHFAFYLFPLLHRLFSEPDGQEKNPDFCDDQDKNMKCMYFTVILVIWHFYPTLENFQLKRKIIINIRSKVF